uniref:Protein kinase domain-containing protein n=1 Tax=Trypanosoma congolense (strain IL3000) TaxID=1068625 RepID=G0UJD9_TRYCI|nr:putative protein kinase [Trypanosoma congolense IL3000]
MSPSKGEHLLLSVGDIINSRFEIVQEVGCGNFSKVYCCFDIARRGDGRRHPVAVKVVKKEYRSDAFFEHEMLQILKRRGKGLASVCNLVEFFEWKGFPVFVLTIYGPSLRERCLGYSNGVVTREKVVQLAKSLLEACRFIHFDCRMVHTDLKPENILLGSLETPKNSLGDKWIICDFGSSSLWRADRLDSDLITTRPYRAPEVVLGNPWYYPADMWSIGCIIFEVAIGRRLFDVHDDVTHLQLMERRLGLLPELFRQNSKHSSSFFDSRGNFRRGSDDIALGKVNTQSLKELLNGDEDLLDFLSLLLVYDPARRATAKEALLHRIFKSTATMPGNGVAFEKNNVSPNSGEVVRLPLTPCVPLSASITSTGSAAAAAAKDPRRPAMGLRTPIYERVLHATTRDKGLSVGESVVIAKLRHEKEQLSTFSQTYTTADLPSLDQRIPSRQGSTATIRKNSSQKLTGSASARTLQQANEFIGTSQGEALSSKRRGMQPTYRSSLKKHNKEEKDPCAITKENGVTTTISSSLDGKLNLKCVPYASSALMQSLKTRAVLEAEEGSASSVWQVSPVLTPQPTVIAPAKTLVADEKSGGSSDGYINACTESTVTGIDKEGNGVGSTIHSRELGTLRKYPSEITKMPSRQSLSAPTAATAKGMIDRMETNDKSIFVAVEPRSSVTPICEATGESLKYHFPYQQVCDAPDCSSARSSTVVASPGEKSFALSPNAGGLFVHLGNETKLPNIAKDHACRFVPLGNAQHQQQFQDEAKGKKTPVRKPGKGISLKCMNAVSTKTESKIYPSEAQGSGEAGRYLDRQHTEKIRTKESLLSISAGSRKHLRNSASLSSGPQNVNYPSRVQTFVPQHKQKERDSPLQKSYTVVKRTLLSSTNQQQASGKSVDAKRIKNPQKMDCTNEASGLSSAQGLSLTTIRNTKRKVISSSPSSGVGTTAKKVKDIRQTQDENINLITDDIVELICVSSVRFPSKPMLEHTSSLHAVQLPRASSDMYPKAK